MLRRTRRWLFHIAAGVSGVMFVTLCLHWGYSQDWRTSFKVFTGRFNMRLVSYRGELGVQFNTLPKEPGFEYTRHHRAFRGPKLLSEHCSRHLWGYGIGKMAVIPIWFAMLPTTILPTLWLIRWRRRRGVPEHACVKCDYDLRGTLAAGQRECPECGANVEQDGM